MTEANQKFTYEHQGDMNPKEKTTMDYRTTDLVEYIDE
jgi:hypothetical protein